MVASCWKPNNIFSSRFLTSCSHRSSCILANVNDFEEGDQAASNNDEEEIWNKLQKDIELEEQQQSLAAIKI